MKGIGSSDVILSEAKDPVFLIVVLFCTDNKILRAQRRSE
jgi:hypothetical protein